MQQIRVEQIINLANNKVLTTNGSGVITATDTPSASEWRINGTSAYITNDGSGGLKVTGGTAKVEGDTTVTGDLFVGDATVKSSGDIIAQFKADGGVGDYTRFNFYAGGRFKVIDRFNVTNWDYDDGAGAWTTTRGIYADEDLRSAMSVQTPKVVGITYSSGVIDLDLSGVGFRFTDGNTRPVCVSIVGTADAKQFVVKGHSTQTNNLFELQKNSTTDPVFAVANDGTAYFRSRASGTDGAIHFITGANPELSIRGDATNGYYPELNFYMAGVKTAAMTGYNGLTFVPSAGYGVSSYSYYSNALAFLVKTGYAGVHSVPMFEVRGYQGANNPYQIWQDGRTTAYGTGASVNYPIARRTGLAAVASGTGGTLATNTYYYKVTACNFSNETIGSVEASVAITLGQNAALSWTYGSLEGVDHYRVYRSTTAGSYGASTRVDTTYHGASGVPYYITSFTDTGYTPTSGTPPTSITHDIMTYRKWEGGTGKFIDFEDESGASLAGIFSDGSVGIGATGTPLDQLHILSAGNAGTGVRVINTSTGTSASSKFTLGQSVVGDQVVTLRYSNVNNSVYGGNAAILSAGSAASGGLNLVHEGNYPIYLQTNGAYRMAIHGGGNVTVGSAFDSFSTKFTVVATTDQFKVAYDGSNYLKAVVGATGIATFSAIGSAGKFVFNDSVEATVGGIFGQITDDTVDVTFGMSGGQVVCDSAGGFLFDTSINPVSAIGDWNSNGNGTKSVVDDNNQLITDYGKARAVVGDVGAGTFAVYGGKIFQHYVNETTSGTSQENLYTYTLVGGSLMTNGDTIKCEYGGIFTANTNTKRIYPKFAGTVLATGQTNSTGATHWTVDYFLIRVSNSVVRYSVEFTALGDTPIIETGEITGLDLSAGDYNIDLDGRSVTAAGELTAKLGFIAFLPNA